jgi:Gpi18-like mannosyltransferase
MAKVDWQIISKVFLGWLVVTQLVLAIAPLILPFRPSFPYASELPRYQLPLHLDKLAHFDGVHYLTIAEKGYLGTGLIQAFFPLLPLLMSGLNALIHNTLLSGLLITHVFAFLAFASFYWLVRLHFSRKIACWSLLFFAFFVSCFYLRALYTESLFLTLIFGSLIAAHKKYYWLAGLLAALASAARITGVFLYPSLLYLIYSNDRKNWWAYLAVSLAPMGLLTYMGYLQQVFGDPLYFFHVQSEFGASRQTDLVSLPQVMWRYVKILWTVRPFDWKYYAYVQEFVLSLWALYILVRATLMKHKQLLGYLIFAWPAYLLPTLTGNFSSMPRYLLVCFPLFIYLAWQSRAGQKKFYLTISIILLIINLILFAGGYWVA